MTAPSCGIVSGSSRTANGVSWGGGGGGGAAPTPPPPPPSPPPAARAPARAARAPAGRPRGREAGGRAHAVFADVGTMAGAAALVDGAIEAFGRLDIVVNNAGFGATVTIEEMGEDDWDGVLDTNLKGTYATAHFAVPRMRAQGG